MLNTAVPKNTKVYVADLKTITYHEMKRGQRRYQQILKDQLEMIKQLNGIRNISIK